MKRTLIPLLFAASLAQAQPAAAPSMDGVLRMLAQGRVAEAGTLLQHYRAQRPDDSEALRLQLGLWLDAGRLEEARALLEDALRRKPGQLDLARQLARLQATGGAYAQAVQTLSRVLPAQPTAEDLAFRAALSTRAGNAADALTNWEAACAADTTRADWWMALAEARNAVGDLPGAAAAYHTALASGQLDQDKALEVQRRLRRLAKR